MRWMIKEVRARKHMRGSRGVTSSMAELPLGPNANLGRMVMVVAIVAAKVRARIARQER